MPRGARPLVARHAELEALTVAVLGAAERRPSVTVVHGEAGIGKSRLVHELVERQPVPGVVVLRGDCFRVDAGELPFAPLAAALRDVDPDALAAGAREVSRGARRQLGHLFPHLFEVDDYAQAVDSDRHAERQQFDALVCLLDRLSFEAPLLLVLEDFQWVDPSTSDFVGFLARSVRDERLATVLVYRTDAPPEEDRAARVVGELITANPDAGIQVGPLSVEALAEHARNVMGEMPAPWVVDRLANRSQGNPYFAEELLAAHIAGESDSVPAVIANAALPRVARVSEEAQLVLRLVAGIQRPVSWALLERACGLPRDALSRALREALDCHLLIDDEHGDKFSFRHDLVREAVYGRMHAGERMALHVAIADALTARDEGGPAELAFQWTQAGRPDAALPACVAAGLDAERARVFAAAAGHFGTANALWDQLEAPPDRMDLDRIDLLAHLTDARRHAGDYVGAEAACRQALEALDPSLEPRRAAAFHERLGALNSTRSEVALSSFRRALELVPDADGARRARLVAEEAYALWGLDRWTEACERARAAIVLADAEHAGPDAFYARVVLGLALGSAGHREQGERTLRSALDHPERADADDRLRAHLYLGEVRRMQGRFSAACEAMDDGAELAGRLGLSGSFGHYMTVNAASDLFHLGRWADADVRLGQLRDLQLESWTEILACQVRAQLALARDQRPDAVVALERAKALGDAAAPEFLPPVYATLAELVLVETGPESARAIVAEGLIAVEGKAELLYAPMLYSTAARVEADAAAGERGDDEVARAAWRRHGDLAAQMAAAGAGVPPPTAAAHLASCRAEALRAEACLAGRRRADGVSSWQRAAAAWTEVSDAWTAVASPYPAAYAAWRRAEALLMRAGRRSVGPGLLRAANAEAGRLGAVRLAMEIAAMAARAGIELTEPETPKPRRVPAPHGLTRRELDVLALLAEGRSNQAIADELVISVRTAETHVAHVLTKLGVTSRAQAASVGSRGSLADALNRRL